jgi:hypothetical protein
MADGHWIPSRTSSPLGAGRGRAGGGYEEYGERIPALSTAPGQSAPERPAVILRPALVPVTRVVVGVDGSAGSVAALHWAAAAAVRWQAGLRIVSAWEEPAQGGPPSVGHSAQTAARIVQTALARVLGQQYYPRRIACAAVRGAPGNALLSHALDTGLLVLGTARAGADRRPGATGRYCLQHGCGPLVLVPANASCLLRFASGELPRSSGAYPGIVYKTRLEVPPAGWWRFPGGRRPVSLSGYVVRPCPSAGPPASC